MSLHINGVFFVKKKIDQRAIFLPPIFVRFKGGNS